MGRFALMWLSASILLSCATYRSELHRGQRYYEENNYEAALALWRSLEANQDALTPEEQLRYLYFRGMTAYRLGYPADARYWLSLAQAGEQLRRASLPGDYKTRLEGILEELNTDFREASLKKPSLGQPSPERRPLHRIESPPVEVDPAGAPCSWSSDCPEGYICQDRVCVEL